MDTQKQSVKHHWEQETCGTRYGDSRDPKSFYEETAAAKYRLEPYIREFARFDETANSHILEIGVGGGADFSQWFASTSNTAIGVDLTEAGIQHTRKRLQALEIDTGKYDLLVADAEKLPLNDSKFDIVYSYGVLHHSPDTQTCFREAFRVLKPGGEIRCMIYHRPSWTGWMLWVRYALLRGRLGATERDVIYSHLESPGTKAYTRKEARKLLSSCGFSSISLQTKLAPGDTLSNRPSKKYQGWIYQLIWKLFPRGFVRSLGHKMGLFLLIRARKPNETNSAKP